MRRSVVKFGFVLCALFYVTSVHAGIGGKTDKREVIGWVNEPWYCKGNDDCKNIWNTAPYWNYVLISKPEYGSWGTGEWISPKHILTNKHVANWCGRDGRDTCLITTSNYRWLDAKVVEYPGDPYFKDDIETDWSILEVEDYTSNHYFGYRSPTPLGSKNLWRAGFGGLKVLSDQDIKNIRAAYSELLSAKNDTTNDMKQIDLNYHNNDIHADPDYYKTFLKKFTELTGKDFIEDYLGDMFTLKIIRNCSIGEGKYSGTAAHNCQSWGGDSGSSIQNASNQIVLLNRSGYRFVTSDKEFINQGILTEQIFTDNIITLLKKAKNEHNKSLLTEVQGESKTLLNQEVTEETKNRVVNSLEKTKNESKGLQKVQTTKETTTGNNKLPLKKSNEKDVNDIIKDLVYNIN